jgi:CDP-6-deoxy-D-xylo-4-hexulose-3-dehydrase
MIPLMKNAFLQEQRTRELLSAFLVEDCQLSMGNKCVAFESSFSVFQGRKFSVLFNSGASANLALLQSCVNIGLLKAGQNVGFSALTWATNVMPIIQMQLIPVPIDCSPETLNVMSRHIEQRLSEVNIDALFLTNALGFAGDLPRIREMCLDKKILLLEDNCESLGTLLPEGKSGNFGFASTFSFYVAHHMSTIEGGMVCTDDEDLYCMLKIVRANGWDRNLSKERQEKIRKKNHIESELQARYCFYDLGFNLRPTEITGFLGCVQLEFLPFAIEQRVRNYNGFLKTVQKNPDLLVIDSSHIDVVSNFALPVLCRNQKLKEIYLDRFYNAQIEIRPIIAGNIQNQPFYKKYANKYYDLPGADFIDMNGFYCGNSPDYNEEELSAIYHAVNSERR